MMSSVSRRRVIAAFCLAFALIALQGLLPSAARISGSKAAARAPYLDSKFKGEDGVTRAIRSRSNVLSRVYVESAEDRAAAGRMGEVVEDYGSFVLVAKNADVKAKGFGLEEEQVETTVNLPGANFDPVADPPQGSLRLGKAAAARDGYYILQFGGTATAEWLRSVSDAGVEVLQYVSHNAYIVYGDAEAIARVAEHSRVRWMGEYTADQKLSAVVLRQLDSAKKGVQPGPNISPIEFTKKQTALFDVAVFSRADLDKTASDLQRAFGKGYLRQTRLPYNFINFVRMELNPDDVANVAAAADVFSIEPVIRSRNEDARSNQILAGNYSSQTALTQTDWNPFLQFGTDGRMSTVSVVDDGIGIPGDGGFYITEQNTKQAPLRGATSGAFGHGHLNATIIAGSNPFAPQGAQDPNLYNYGIGVAPGANLVSIPRNRAGYSGDDATVYDDSISTAGANFIHATISNNSWGDGTNLNVYGDKEIMFDGFVRDASLGDGRAEPITLIFSAGNLGPGNLSLTRPKSAKNLIVVGSSEGLRSTLAGTAADNMDDLAVDSSRGPTADGRIKPDIVAPGTAITGGRSGLNNLSGNIDTFHRWSSGTSHAAAHISGVAALFDTWYKQSFSNEPVTPSLMKAALINSTVDLTGQGTDAPVPNGSEGWGRPNLKTMFHLDVNAKYVNESSEFTATGQTPYVINGSVMNSSKPVRVTLAWTDPPGTADPALVNNLDLEVTVGGVTYKGNVFSNGVSVAGGTADSKNNVECVFLPAGIPAGTFYSIKVKPTAINGDGVLFNGLPFDQRYSLVIYNYSAAVGQSTYSLEGRVISATDRGIGMATVRITDPQGGWRETRTNPFGRFAFSNVLGGQNWRVTVNSKRYVVAPQDVMVSSNVSGVILRANPGAP